MLLPLYRGSWWMSLTVLGVVLDRKCPYHCRVSLLCLPLRIKGTCEIDHFAASGIRRCMVPAGREHSSAWPLTKDASTHLAIDVARTTYSCLASGPKVSTGDKADYMSSCEDLNSWWIHVDSYVSSWTIPVIVCLLPQQVLFNQSCTFILAGLGESWLPRRLGSRPAL